MNLRLLFTMSIVLTAPVDSADTCTPPPPWCASSSTCDIYAWNSKTCNGVEYGCCCSGTYAGQTCFECPVGTCSRPPSPRPPPPRPPSPASPPAAWYMGPDNSGTYGLIVFVVVPCFGCFLLGRLLGKGVRFCKRRLDGMPIGWEEARDNSGRQYFYNRRAGVSTYDDPRQPAGVSLHRAPGPPPPGPPPPGPPPPGPPPPFPPPAGPPPPVPMGLPVAPSQTSSGSHICQYCKAALHSRMKFCSECGAQIDAAHAPSYVSLLPHQGSREAVTSPFNRGSSMVSDGI